ncbi:MAG: hypothetical protein AAB839_02195, partial [Patescibacteria group bacterium]
DRRRQAEVWAWVVATVPGLHAIALDRFRSDDVGYQIQDWQPWGVSRKGWKKMGSLWLKFPRVLGPRETMNISGKSDFCQNVYVIF